MYYVLNDDGLVAEFDTFEEAEAFIASQNCPDDFWVSSDDEPDDCYDECGFDPYEGCYTYDC